MITPTPSSRASRTRPRARVRYGRYEELGPLIRELYVERAVPSRLIAEWLGLSRHTLGVRLAEWGLGREREERHARVLEEVAGGVS